MAFNIIFYGWWPMCAQLACRKQQKKRTKAWTVPSLLLSPGVSGNDKIRTVCSISNFAQDHQNLISFAWIGRERKRREDILCGLPHASLMLVLLSRQSYEVGHSTAAAPLLGEINPINRTCSSVPLILKVTLHSYLPIHHDLCASRVFPSPLLRKMSELLLSVGIDFN